MHHHDDISVTFAEENGGECEEHAVPNDDSGNAIPTHTKIGMICMIPNEPVKVAMKLGQDFDFRDANGLRVVIAVGRGELSPENAQSFWVSRDKLTRDKTVAWPHFWTWSGERAKKCNRRLKAPAPSDGYIEQISVDQWEEAMNAPKGGIAVYVTRDTLPGKTKRGSKRCTTDPPESAQFDEETHPIRAEWFEPLPGEAGQTYVFVSMNVSEETFDGQPSNDSAHKGNDEDQDSASDESMSFRSQSDYEEVDHMPRNGSKYTLRSKRSQRTSNQHRSISGRIHSSQTVPAPHRKGSKRKASYVYTEGLAEDKKIKFEDAVSETEWEPYDGIDELLIRKDAGSKYKKVSPAIGRNEMTAADTIDRKSTGQESSSSSNLVHKNGRSVLLNDEQRAERLEKKRLELQKAELGLYRKDVEYRRQEIEYEERTGKMLDE